MLFFIDKSILTITLLLFIFVTNIMSLRYSLCAITSLFLLSPFIAAGAEQNILAARPAAPPLSPEVEEYFGTKVTDNFRSLEKLDNPQVQKWIKEQSDDAKATLQRIPGRNPLIAKMQDFD